MLSEKPKQAFLSMSFLAVSFLAANHSWTEFYFIKLSQPEFTLYSNFFSVSLYFENVNPL